MLPCASADIRIVHPYSSRCYLIGNSEVPCGEIHGNLAQAERAAALEESSPVRAGSTHSLWRLIASHGAAFAERLFKV